MGCLNFHPSPTVIKHLSFPLPHWGAASGGPVQSQGFHPHRPEVTRPPPTPGSGEVAWRAIIRHWGSGPITGNYNASPGSPQQGKLPPSLTILVHSQRSADSEGSYVKDSGPPGWSCFSANPILAQAPPPGSLLTGELENTLLHSWVHCTFLLLALPPFPVPTPTLGFIKQQEPSVQQKEDTQTLTSVLTHMTLNWYPIL